MQYQAGICLEWELHSREWLKDHASCLRLTSSIGFSLAAVFEEPQYQDRRDFWKSCNGVIGLRRYLEWHSYLIVSKAVFFFGN